MAVPLFTNVASNLLKLRGAASGIVQQSMRWKMKFTKRRGWKKYEHDYVEQGMIIFRQFGLYVYPGENVGISRDLTLFALRPGRVMISREKLSPHPRSALKPAVDAGEVFYKYFFHVVPIDPQPGLFKLVSQI